MSIRSKLLLAIACLVAAAPPASGQSTDPARDILVTFENDGARATTVGAPYRARKRYAISASALQQSAAVAREYGLKAVDHWPIRSLSVYCFVYRVPEDADRAAIIERLRADERVESAQELRQFETSTKRIGQYDDTYANLQHGLSSLNLTHAHRYSLGEGIRIAVVDSAADTDHEDLRGRIRNVDDFSPADVVPDRRHGTAVTSVIAANANNATGIVGVAPEAQVDLYIACWSGPDADAAICDSFTLAKAIDTVLDQPPDVLNLSLAGPFDPLVGRLLKAASRSGVVLVAALPAENGANFPASMDEVIAVEADSRRHTDPSSISAPGNKILVAVPDNAYDFRSGSSLAAAHVSGVVALMLSAAKETGPESVPSILEQAQVDHAGQGFSLDACRALQLTRPTIDCGE